MKTATFIKEQYSPAGARQRLYRLDPPMKYTDYDEDSNEVALDTEYVVVSGVNAMLTGPETYIFPSDAEGKITGWMELDGSFRGSIDHEAALENAGYQVKEA